MAMKSSLRHLFEHLVDYACVEKVHLKVNFSLNSSIYSVIDFMSSAVRLLFTVFEDS